MKLAYSTNAYTQTDLASGIESVAKLGFTGVEILCDRPHWFPGEVETDEVARIKTLLDKTGLQVSNLNANTSNGYFNPMPPENVFEPALSSANASWRDWRIAYTNNTIKLAREMGARCVSVTSGRPTPGTTPAIALNHFVESLKRICEIAEKNDICVGIEYEPGLLVERANEVLEVIERVGSSKLGVNFDIGHSHLVAENPLLTTRALAGRIWNVHVEDIAGGKHFHLPPGDGTLPIAEYLRALRSIGYQNFLTVELYSYPEQPDAVGQRAISHLQTLLDTL